MELSSKKKKIIGIILFLVVATIIQSLILGNLAKEKRENKISDAYIYGQTIANAMELTLDNTLEATESLKYIYEQYGEDCFDDFDSIAASIMADKPAIASMYIAPKGVISVAYPSSVSDSTIGFDMLHDEKQGERAQLAVDTRMITVAGPHELVEGGIGFIVRNPVFKGDEFIGLTVIVLDWDKFVDQILLNVDKTDNYKFGIYKDNDDSTAVTSTDGFVLKNTNEQISKKVDIEFDVPNDKWHLNVEPVKGFIVVGDMISSIIVSIAITALVFVFSVFLFISTERKKQLLQEQAANETKTEYMEQLTEALNQAKKADQAKSAFLSRMSHDIRTPLNGIIGLIEIGEKHSDDKKLLDENREKAKVAANHLLSLISDVLELSKMDDENVHLSSEPFNILELASDVITITKLRAQESGITVEYSDCSGRILFPYVYGSPLHLRQVLINILGNAIKYNKPNGSIICSVDTVVFSENNVVYRAVIQDTGIGMSPEFVEHLFEPFSQERTDARSVYQGTGLGMAIVKSIVDKMNGNISVESVPGEGSTFTVSIPFKIAKEEDIPKKLDTKLESLDGVNILLAEDNLLNQEIATTILNDLGATVTVTCNGVEAFECYKNNPVGTYDIILMDLLMPEMDGFAATKAIRSFEREDSKSIPIVAMTANAFAEDVQKCMDAGMNGHLAKPIEIPKLLRTIGSVINGKGGL